jgi:hypothetical protein
LQYSTGGAFLGGMDRSAVAETSTERDPRAPAVVNGSRVVLVALLVGVLLAAGCSSGSTPASPATTEHSAAPASSGPDRSTTTTTGAEPGLDSDAAESVISNEIVGRYVAFWDARRDANAGIPNPDLPALRELATGEQLAAVIRETRKNLDDGLAFQDRSSPTAIQRVRLVNVEGDRARVLECVVDDALVIRRATGAVTDDTVATHNVLADLERIDGAWRVSAVRLVQRWEGVAGCALVS